MGTASILIVEDEPATARALHDILAGLGYAVADVLDTGEGAMKRARELRPDLVLMDIILKGSIDGVRAADWIRTSLRIPVIYLTAEQEHSTFERARATGPFAYLPKPVDTRLLHITIETALYRHRAEQQLQESERRYRALLESVTNYVYTVTIESGRAVSTAHGPGCAAVTGYSPEEYRRDPELWYRMVHEDDRAMVLRQAGEMLSGSSFPSIEHRIIHKDGTIRWVRNTPVPNYDAGGRLAAVDGLITDITERRRLEDQLRHAQKMEAVGQLAGGVAHDFNNILSAMIGYASLVQMHLAADDPLRHNVDQILALTERAATLTQGLLAFSRKQVINPRPVDLNEIVRRVDRLLLRVIGEDVELRTVPSPAPLPVMADSGQIEQVLMNMATNARDAMPQGGMLVIRTEAAVIDDTFIKAHSYGREGRYARLTVADTGAGMDEQVRRKIFEPFFTTKETGKGTGLGLAMVYGAVKQHEGFINVYSEPGQGTTFKVYIPLLRVAGEPGTEQAEQAPQDIPRGSETVLVAEDDAILRKLSREVLEEFGYRVIEAADGEEAVQKFLAMQEAIRLVILDVIMPKKNGKEALEAIRLAQPGVKALFTSGYTADIVQKRAIMEQGYEFITKPVSPRDLLKKVREILDARR